MSARKNVLLVGAGNMGTNHARVIFESDRAKLVTLVEPREKVGRHIADRFDAVWSPDLVDLSGLDAVVIAAATEAHYELAMRVLGAGIPLLIEKPVADDLIHTREILDLAMAKDIPFMCGLLERYNPAIITARSLIEAPFHVTATRHSPYAPRIRTGVAWDLLVHDVDLAIAIMGSNPTTVDSRLGQFHPDSSITSDDVAETLLGFANGAIAHISASRIGQRKIRQLSIYEPDKLVEVDLLRRDVTIYRHISESADDGGRGYKQQTVIEIPELLTSQEPLTAQFIRFMDVIDGTIDAAAERASILPAHAVIDRVTSFRPTG